MVISELRSWSMQSSRQSSLSWTELKWASFQGRRVHFCIGHLFFYSWMRGRKEETISLSLSLSKLVLLTILSQVDRHTIFHLNDKRGRRTETRQCSQSSICILRQATTEEVNLISSFWLIKLLDRSIDWWHFFLLSCWSTRDHIRRSTRNSNPVMTSSKGCSDHRFRAPPAYTAQLLTLHQHRANNQYRTANQI